MSAPLLYHVVQNALRKDETVLADFEVKHVKQHRFTGRVDAVQYNPDADSTRIYVIPTEGLSMLFATLSEREMEEQLTVTKDERGTLKIINQSKASEELEEGISLSEDDEPIFITILRQRLESGDIVLYETTYDAGRRDAPITYRVDSMKRIGDADGNPDRTTLNCWNSYKGKSLTLSIPDNLAEAGTWTLKEEKTDRTDDKKVWKLRRRGSNL